MHRYDLEVMLWFWGHFIASPSWPWIEHLSIINRDSLRQVTWHYSKHKYLWLTERLKSLDSRRTRSQDITPELEQKSLRNNPGQDTAFCKKSAQEMGVILTAARDRTQSYIMGLASVRAMSSVLSTTKRKKERMTS